MLNKTCFYIRMAFDVTAYCAIVIVGYHFVRCESELAETRAMMAEYSHSQTSGRIHTASRVMSLTSTSTLRTPDLSSYQQKLYRLTLELNWLAAAGLGVATFLVIGYKTQQYYFFDKPLTKLREKIRKIRAVKGSKSDETRSANGVVGMVEELLDAQARTHHFIEEIGKGNLEVQADFENRDKLSQAMLSMQQKLRAVSAEEKKNAWINESLTALEKLLKTEATETGIYNSVISMLTQRVGGLVGTFYLYHDNDQAREFRLAAAFGCYNNKETPRSVPAGEGQLGQLAYEPQLVQISNVPTSYLIVHSGLGSSAATHIVIVPLVFKDTLYGAIEVGLFEQLKPHQQQWLERAAESIGAYLFNQYTTQEAKRKLESLTQRQAQELIEIHALQRKTNEQLQMKLQEADGERIKNEAILQGCVDGVICFTAQGKITLSNKAFQEMLLMDAGQIKQKTIGELLPIQLVDNGGTIKPHFIKGEVKREIQIRTEATFTSANGEDLDVLVTATEVSANHETLYTFFIQKISVDLF